MSEIVAIYRKTDGRRSRVDKGSSSARARREIWSITAASRFPLEDVQSASLYLYLPRLDSLSPSVCEYGRFAEGTRPHAGCSS